MAQVGALGYIVRAVRHILLEAHDGLRGGQRCNRQLRGIVINVKDQVGTLAQRCAR